MLMLAVAGLPGPATAQDSSCLACHADQRQGQQAFHAVPCSRCHAGDPKGNTVLQAHQGLTAFPGNLSNAGETCGQCHAAQVGAVQRHRMTTSRGMVATTRRVLGETDDGAGIRELGHGIADSLLRKLCAACHLGRDKDVHGHATRPMGGGCLACHLDDHPPQGHVRLTRRISDARCFSCHARSGRISLNYAGLAELDEQAPADDQQRARLPDGRLVRLRETDVHHQAGMACIDCHGQGELMGHADGHVVTATGTAVRCEDCHRPLSADDSGSRLPQLEITAQGTGLIRRHDGQRLPVPPLRPADHPLAQQHRRLSCDACHTQWAPLCYGCHVAFEPEGEQFDYLENRPTPGSWQERRWMTDSGPPPLGVDADGRIKPFVPGMILTLEHPQLNEPLFRRLFAPLSPHTTGKSRSCQSCHCDSRALGLGAGRLEKDPVGWRLQATGSPLADGLPADAWHDLHHVGQGQSSHPGARPFNATEIDRILGAGVACEAPSSP
jgi:hypothetical protein